MNHAVKSFARVLALGGLLLGGLSIPPADAQDTSKDAAGVKPDNTKVNKRDRSPSALTADNQKENKPDRQVAAEIRRAVVKDKDLSTYAHNVKIIVTHGNVTLKGPVRSEDEKKSVEAKATEVAGAGKVTNQLSISTAKTKRSKKMASQT